MTGTSLVFSEIETGMLQGVFQFHVKQTVVCRLSQFLRQIGVKSFASFL